VRARTWVEREGVRMAVRARTWVEREGVRMAVRVRLNAGAKPRVIVGSRDAAGVLLCRCVVAPKG
jgi:hypothetical protein